jgi:hypothetical protein
MLTNDTSSTTTEQPPPPPTTTPTTSQTTTRMCITQVTTSACKCADGSSDGVAVQTTQRNCAIVSSIVSCRCVASTTSGTSGSASIGTESSAEVSSTSASTVALTTGIIASSTSSPVSDDGLHPGYAALIAVVVVCAVIAIVIATVFIVSRRRRAAAASAAAAAGAGADAPAADEAAPAPESKAAKKRALVGDDRRLSQISNVADGDNYALNVREVAAAAGQADVHQLLVLQPSTSARTKEKNKNGHHGATKSAPKKQKSDRQKPPPHQAGTEYDHVAEIDHRGNGSDAPTYDRVRGEHSGRRDHKNGKVARQESVATNLAPIAATKQALDDDSDVSD